MAGPKAVIHPHPRASASGKDRRPATSQASPRATTSDTALLVFASNDTPRCVRANTVQSRGTRISGSSDRSSVAWVLTSRRYWLAKYWWSATTNGARKPAVVMTPSGSASRAELRPPASRRRAGTPSPCPDGEPGRRPPPPAATITSTVPLTATPARSVFTCPLFTAGTLSTAASPSVQPVAVGDRPVCRANRRSPFTSTAAPNSRQRMPTGFSGSTGAGRRRRQTPAGSGTVQAGRGVQVAPGPPRLAGFQVDGQHARPAWLLDRHTDTDDDDQHRPKRQAEADGRGRTDAEQRLLNAAPGPAAGRSGLRFIIHHSAFILPRRHRPCGP